MIATITVQSHRMAATQDHHRVSRNANAAGAPLPIIPRRMSLSRPALQPSPSCPLPTRGTLSASSSSSSFASTSTSTTTPTVTTITTITPATPPRDDSDSSTSSTSDGTRPTIRPKHVRGVRHAAVCPPELSTPIPTLAAASTPSTPGSRNNNGNNTPESTPPSTFASASAFRPLIYTPGMPLRLSVDSLKAMRHNSVSPPGNVSLLSPDASASVQGSLSASALCESFSTSATKLVRKKSGQLVKPSLKTSRSVSRNNSLSVITFGQSSKSEPTTPTSKAVHFDAKLEHVKLFLAEQKPLAVSRDGSPTDDTSGTDSDFPRFIYGADDPSDGARQKRLRLVMQVVNMPSWPSPTADVSLEELVLAPDGTSITGRVRVRNIAFAKLVAVRFTFDSWQTTSEVTARWVESPAPEWDRFAFAIRLNDLLARIEGKTLVLAVKYAVEGREMWDNNHGMNYVATFVKAKPAREEEKERRAAVAVAAAASLSDDEAGADMADLKSKLEKVVLKRQHDTAEDDAGAAFKSSASFASRYDFANSLKSAWRPPPALDGGASGLKHHHRAQSFPVSRRSASLSPTGSSSPSSSIPWPQKTPSDPYGLRRAPQPHASTLGSPRDFGDDVFHPAHLVEPEDAPFIVQPPPKGPRAGRTHQRGGGYFDLSFTPTPTSGRREPPSLSPGTPRSPLEGNTSPASPPRYNSFPPVRGALSPTVASPVRSPSLSPAISTPTPVSVHKLGGLLAPPPSAPLPASTAPSPSPLAPLPFPVPAQMSRDSSTDTTSSSALSTPSMVTPSSSRSNTPSPTPEMFLRGLGMPMDLPEKAVEEMSPEAHYRQFLNQFCFFTGPNSSYIPAASAGEEDELIPRTHSASDIEELLSGLSPHLEALAAACPTPTSPTRSSSLDDLMLSRSGSLTPTVSRLSMMEVAQGSGTPVPTR